MRSQAGGMNWLRCTSLPYGPKVIRTGNVPSARGRKILARRIGPSRIGIAASFSSSISWTSRRSILRVDQHERYLAGSIAAIHPSVIGALLNDDFPGLKVNFGIVEQHVDFAGQNDSVVERSGPVHAWISRMIACWSFGREPELFGKAESGFVIRFNVFFRGELYHSENRAIGRRKNSCWLSIWVGTLRNIGGRRGRQPKKNSGGPGFLARTNIGRGAVHQYDSFAGRVFTCNYPANGRWHGISLSVIGPGFNTGASHKLGCYALFFEIQHGYRAVAVVGHQHGPSVGSKRKAHGIFTHLEDLLLAVEIRGVQNIDGRVQRADKHFAAVGRIVNDVRALDVFRQRDLIDYHVGGCVDH